MPCRRAVLLLAAVAACTTGVPPQPARLPNIVVLYADDLGYGDVACFAADSKIPTPNLDRLAGEGLRCTDAHSSSGICSPSRYAILTGRHHWRQFHEIVDSFGPSVFEPGRITIADMLRARGYATACIGKWHLGWDWRAIQVPGIEQLQQNGHPAGYPPAAFDWSKPIPGGPLAHGFDSYFGDDVPNFPPYAWIENDRVVAPPTVQFAPSPQPEEGSAEGRPGPMVADWRLDAVMPTLTDRAVAWLRAQQHSAQPFFLYFAFTSPHAPIVPTTAFRGRSGAGPYGDYVAQTDATVGAVLTALDELGMRDDTIVVFTSDNGPERYAFERVRRYQHRSMGPLRGVKRDVWEGGHRVPMIVRWPGVVRAGRTTDALIGQVDLMATLADIVGFALPDSAAEDSFDLMPLWRGAATKVRDFLVHDTYADKWAVRRGDWLYLDAPDGEHNPMPEWFAAAEGFPKSTAPHLLFDLRADPGERHDVADAHPEVVAELQVLLRRLREQGHSAPRLER